MKWTPNKIIDSERHLIIFIWGLFDVQFINVQNPKGESASDAISMDLTVYSTYYNLAPHNMQLREY